MNQITVTLPNGLMLMGTQEQIVSTAIKLGFSNPFAGEYYNSSTHGLMRIADMDTRHLRNAVLKMLRENPGENSTTWRNMVYDYLGRDLTD